MQSLTIRRLGFPERPPGHLPFYPRSCGCFDYERGFRREESGRQKPMVHLFWGVKGRGRFETMYGTFDFREGDFFYLLPFDSWVSESCSSSWIYRWLTFDGPCAADFIRSYDYPIHLKNAGRCPEELFQEFERGLKENSLISLRRLVGIITEILSLIGGIHDDSTPEARLIRCFIETVRDHYMQSQVNVNIIAEMLGVHRSTLSRILTEKMNTSPGRYLLQVRIHRSHTL